MKTRRVTVYQDHADEWRYTVQAGNWQVIEAAEEGMKRKRTVLDRIAKKYPGVEVVIEDKRFAPEDW